MACGRDDDGGLRASRGGRGRSTLSSTIAVMLTRYFTLVSTAP